MTEKKKFEMVFRTSKGFLESRQTRQYSLWQAEWEASLYAAWATFHYDCEVFYEVKEQ